ncbi:hypothetical protein BDA96_04G201500 [Sorghum bicolor]|uniref:Uncharacterized protein n=1 Tax=Sorghum bicolor TaxID=4558 RepID=A0A921R568_SORBI|nr:hypothetical protein BDA96_04G201500 [Sorghum bicolor]KAG0533537.1 hypothetical protein BDA96_04G201500 [Sorghum bicolor]
MTTRGSTAPTDDEPSVKVVVSAQPTVSRRVDSKDLWFVRRTASDSIVVRGGWHPRRQGLLGRCIWSGGSIIRD